MSTILSSWLCCCFCFSKSMAMKKVLTFLVLLLFVQCSSSSRMFQTNIEGTRPIATTSIEVATRFGNEAGAASSVPTVEDSARLVPTGPDPLHHNNSPLGH